MPYHTIQVSRPFDVATQQVLELDEAWLEDAVRTATGPGAACGGTRLPGPDPTLGVPVRVGWPCWGRGVFTLPMEWEVTGSLSSWALSGELEVRQVSAGETRIGVKMVAASEPVPRDHPEQSRVEENAEVATRSFLRRVFWTLEALNRYDLLDPGAGG